MKHYVVIILGAVIIFYLIIGGLVFYVLESPEEKRLRSELRNTTQAFQDRCGARRLTDEELQALVLTYLQLYEDGEVSSTNLSEAGTSWDYANAVIVSITIITTIGYGHKSPLTQAGRIFCVLYAVLGIPLFLVLMAELGRRMKQLFGLCTSKYDGSGSGTQYEKACVHALRLGLALGLWLVVFLILPSVGFLYMEGWPMSEGLYFGIITLTTVGLGDLVAAQHSHEISVRNLAIYRVLVGFWIFLGLGWVAGISELLRAAYDDVIAGNSESETDKDQTVEVDNSDENQDGRSPSQTNALSADDQISAVTEMTYI